MIQGIVEKLFAEGLLLSQDYTPLTSSENHRVYEVGNVIIKIDKKEEKLKKEYDILHYLAPQLRCPQALFFKKFDGYFVLGMERLTGQSLSELRPHRGQPLKEKLIRSVTDAVEILQKKALPEVANLPEYYSRLMDLRHRYYPRAAKNPQVDSEDMLFLSERFSALQTEVSRHYTSVLIHHDLRYKNILATPEWEITGILDFEDIMTGPRYREYFRADYLLFIKSYSKKDGKDSDPSDIDFLTRLVKKFEENIQVPLIRSPERALYAIAMYIKLLSRFDQEGYNHALTECYREHYLGHL